MIGEVAKTVVAIHKVTDSAHTLDQCSEVIGTGILVSDRHVLTCAHVVASALGRKATDSNAPSQQVPLQVGVICGLRKKQWAKVPAKPSGAKSNPFWIPVKKAGAQQQEEDIAILELSEPVPFQYPKVTWSDNRQAGEIQFFGFGGERDGEWVKGEYMGPGTNWDQINTNSTEVWKGFSGSGVYDPERGKLIGMLVAAQIGKPQVYLIHRHVLARILEPLLPCAPKATPVNTTNLSLESILSRLLDRTAQCNTIKETLISHTLQSETPTPRNHCFIVECSSHKDVPEYLADKYLINHHLAQAGLNDNKLKAAEAVKLTLEESSGRDFDAALNRSNIVGPVSKWLAEKTLPKVIYVQSSSGNQIIYQVKSVLEWLQKLEQSGRVATTSSIAVVVPYYSAKYGWLERTKTQFQLKKLMGEKCSLLEPLGQIESGHLESFTEQLPDAALTQFRSRYKQEDITNDFLDCMGNEESKHYHDVAKEFKAVLRKRDLTIQN